MLIFNHAYLETLFEISEAPVGTGLPFTNRGEISHTKGVPKCSLHLRAKLSLDRFILLPLKGENPQVLLLFNFDIQ